MRHITLVIVCSRGAKQLPSEELLTILRLASAMRISALARQSESYALHYTGVGWFLHTV